MKLCRLFLPQEALDTWLTSGVVDIEQDTLTIGAIKATLQLTTALHFTDEVAGGGDENNLVGTVQDLEQLETLGGEHCADSVILGDNAYQVVEGFAASVVSIDTPDEAAGTSEDPLVSQLASRLRPA